MKLKHHIIRTVPSNRPRNELLTAIMFGLGIAVVLFTILLITILWVSKY